MPWFIDLQNKYSARGLQVIGIALDDDATPVEIGEFADGLRVNYVVLIGSPETADSYGGIPMMPVTFVIDRDGKVADKLIGVNERSAFEKSVRSALSSASLRAEDQSLSDESTLPKKQ
jgi:peroxiredoxin